MWYMVVYICGIGYYCKFYLGGINEIYDFFILFFLFPSSDMAKNNFKFQMEIFINFKNEYFKKN
jgi:hypothetical protein